METSSNFAKVEMLIRKPTKQVFNAFVDPDITTKFWFTKSSGKLAEGQNVTWAWEMYNVEVPVEVIKVVPNECIMIEWGTDASKSTVEWNFKTIAETNTFVTITNSNIQGSGEELHNKIVDSTGGFTMVVAGLKAWLEHGIQLNLVGDKFPEEMRS